MQKTQGPKLANLFNHSDEEKLTALPLQFQYLPVQILSKEFTKLNNNSKYRIYYMGPRPLNSLILHRKYAYNENITNPKSELDGYTIFPRYYINTKKIITSNFINEKLQDNRYYKSAMFYRAFQGMNPTLADKSYIFNSAFQSGNLDCVIKTKPTEFDLFLRIDSNTRGHTNWYYFSIKNEKKCEKITINICNLKKPSCLYEQGFKPFILSKKKYQKQGRKWQQGGTNCFFQQQQFRYEAIYQKINPSITYCLSFDYEFTESEDQVFFAYAIPYTYSQLIYDVGKISKSPYVKAETLCRSLTGLDIPIMHISNHENQSRNKKNIMVTARIHPGESNGSHVLIGFLKWLLGQSKEALEALEKSNFFVIPMVNPDGVIMGNSRTSAAGKDLNRQFHTQRGELYPQVFHIKKITAALHRKYGVTMYLDFHGHSSKKNTFVYGPSYNLGDANYLKCRLFPKLIEKVNSSFRFYSCSFMIAEEKKTTARAIMFQRYKIPFVYTVQSSIGLYYNSEEMKTHPFIEQTWNQIGICIALGMHKFLNVLDQYEEMTKIRKIQRTKIKENKEKMNKKSKKFFEDEIFDELKYEGKQGSLMMDMMEDLKQTITQMKNMDAEVSSDEHDEKDNLESFKLAEFNNLIIQNKQKQKRMKKKVFLEEQQMIIDPVEEPEKQQIKQVQKQETFTKRSSQSEKRPTEMIFQRKIDSKRITESRNSKQSPLKNNIPRNYSNDKQRKNFVVSNKQRYKLIARNLVLSEDKCQIIQLPKNIQNIRKEIRIGRTLISNVWQSRLRFAQKTGGTVRQEPQLKEPKTQRKKEKTKIHHINFDSAKKSNTGKKNEEKSNRFRKSLSQALHLQDFDLYSTLEGFEIDNRAMKITTFKKL